MPEHTFTGTVDTYDRSVKSRPPRITVQLDDDPWPRTLRAGTRVAIRTILDDAEIGRRLREMLTKSSLDGDDLRASVNDLADTLDDYAGWPILADLVREVGP